MEGLRTFEDKDEQEIFEIAMMAIKRHLTYEVICATSVYWLSLARLYEVLARHKEIVSITDLPYTQKMRYWLTALRCRPEKPLWVKKMLCQAMYVFDLINNKTGHIYEQDND